MKRLIIISLLFASPTLWSQQQFVFTNYLLNHYYYNPALAGSQDVHIANIGYRNQWVGFDESPVTIHGNFYGSMKNKMKHGYGVSIVTDRSGLAQNTNIHANYAYHLKMTDSLRLGFGIRPGWVQNSVKLYDAILADAGDDILTGNVLSYNAIDLGAGLYLYHPKFFVTIAMRHMIGKVFSFTTWNYGLAKHFTFAGGYNFVNKKRTVEFQPSVMLQYVKTCPSAAECDDENDIQRKVLVWCDDENSGCSGSSCRYQAI